MPARPTVECKDITLLFAVRLSFAEYIQLTGTKMQFFAERNNFLSERDYFKKFVNKKQRNHIDILFPSAILARPKMEVY